MKRNRNETKTRTNTANNVKKACKLKVIQIKEKIAIKPK